MIVITSEQQFFNTFYIEGVFIMDKYIKQIMDTLL